MNSRFCRLYVDIDWELETLNDAVVKATGGRIERFSIRTSWGEADVRRNKEHDLTRKMAPDDGFLFGRYFVELEPHTETKEHDYVRSVAELVVALRRQGISVVPSCDFEEKLPAP